MRSRSQCDESANMLQTTQIIANMEYWIVLGQMNNIKRVWLRTTLVAHGLRDGTSLVAHNVAYAQYLRGESSGAGSYEIDNT